MLKTDAKGFEAKMWDDNHVVGDCEHWRHEEAVDQGTFERKGCWRCQHFRYGEGWFYLRTDEAAERYSVSIKTIYRWIRQGKLKARLFKCIRGGFSMGNPPRFYAILPKED
jgi:hypothetical protein